MRGVRLSKDGDSWYLPRPDEFKDLCELEKSGLIFFEENKEIPDDSTSFSELLGIDLLSLEDAVSYAGLHVERAERTYEIKCKQNHELHCLMESDPFLIVYCPECKTGLLNMISFLDITGAGSELFQPDVNYDEMWLPLNEDLYKRTIDALSVLISAG
ncbi:hypothetical protein DS67_01600 [Mesotoga sp. SC_4PWA21]|nr:hypothetical protein DS67_01600 [Mesotoga sp. SC_4PWA21]